MPMLYYGGLFVHSILCGILLLLLPYSGMEKILERSPLTIVGKMSYELYDKIARYLKYRRAIRFHMGSKSYLRDEETAKEFRKAQDEELWNLILVCTACLDRCDCGNTVCGDKIYASEPATSGC